MISAWTSVIVLLMPVVSGARNEGDTQPCAEVQTSSSVVLLGSSVSASCVIRDSCLLVIHQGAVIEWQLDNHTLHGSSSTSEGGKVSKVYIPSFTLPRAVLTCSIQAQVVGEVKIRAGYPPEKPKNISCQTNLTSPNTMTCSWDPGQRNPLLPTSYSLHTVKRVGKKNHSYEVPSGLNYYIIPRAGLYFFSEMEIYVKAVNQLGEATSLYITLEPVSAAKFDPPVIEEIGAKGYGCLSLRWNLSSQQAWMHPCRMNLEVRVKTVDSSQWMHKPILHRKIKSREFVDQCSLLNGMEYLVQVRVRYKESPWSEWSRSQSGVTLESAPSGYLHWWIKDLDDQMNKHLMWKASKEFRPNSQNITYVVSGEKGPICSTKWNNCTFRLSSKTAKLNLKAVNAAGKSKPTEILIPVPEVHIALPNVSATPHDDRSLMVRWRSVVSPDLVGFIVEWRPLLNTDISLTQFELTDSNHTNLILEVGSFESYKPYEVSVYPRFKVGIGLNRTVFSYLRQKAPSAAPTNIVESNIDQRNGNILSDLEKDVVVTVISVILAFVALTIFITILIYFSSHRWIKVHFWPAIPDPANSSIKRWSSESTQDTQLTSESEEPNLVYLSHLSFLDIPLKSSQEDEDEQLSNADSADDCGDSTCVSPFIPQFSAPYSTVVFSSPCNSPTTETPPVYLRSESTQPLLATEESLSPQYYQNIDNDGFSGNQCFLGPCNAFVKDEADTEIRWDDFPLLRSLEMNYMQDE